MLKECPKIVCFKGKPLWEFCAVMNFLRKNFGFGKFVPLCANFHNSRSAPKSIPFCTFRFWANLSNLTNLKKSWFEVFKINSKNLKIKFWKNILSDGLKHFPSRTPPLESETRKFQDRNLWCQDFRPAEFASTDSKGGVRGGKSISEFYFLVSPTLLKFQIRNSSFKFEISLSTSNKL